MTEDEFTNNTLMLDVGDDHHIYVQDWGTLAAKVPIIYLHGGPGSGCSDKAKLPFDPEHNRVIFFDQRGSGKSTPFGSTQNNTTDDLIEDINKIKKHLFIDKCILLGGSWGSALALAYAIKHPENIEGIIIDGVFTASKNEADWVDKGKFRKFYPDIWQEYENSVPDDHKADPTAYHLDKINNGSPAEIKRSCYEYSKLESAIVCLDEIFTPENYVAFDPTSTKIELHYLSNGCFLPENYIMGNLAKLTMPIKIIQGRYDMVCPPDTAFKVHKTLPNSELIWVIGGHLRQHEAKNIQKLFIKQLVGKA